MNGRNTSRLLLRRFPPHVFFLYFFNRSSDLYGCDNCFFLKRSYLPVLLNLINRRETRDTENFNKFFGSFANICNLLIDFFISAPRRATFFR